MSYIKGLDSLLSKLNALPNVIQEGAEDRVRKSVAAIKKDAKDLAPVDTGALKDSIVTDVVRKSPAEVEGTVTAEKDYAPAVEFGTGQLGSKSQQAKELGINLKNDTSVEGRAPKPFMYPAYVLHKEETKEGIKTDVRNRLREVARR